MEFNTKKKKIAILGGGPSGLFSFKRLVEANRTDFEIHIFEVKKQLGAGMPYSHDGANKEHVTNVSDNEIPEIVTSISEWIQTLPEEMLEKFKIDISSFNEFKVLPRLLFGQYLSAQFDLLIQQAQIAGIQTHIHSGTKILNITDQPEKSFVQIETDTNGTFEFDCIIICTGHNWPKKNEGVVEGYFDSPYPPAKLAFKANHPVAIRGSSLTAIDAIRTLSRKNGAFHKDETNGKLSFKVNDDSPDFRLVMHSRNGLLPAVRFHLEEPLVSTDSLLSQEEIDQNIAENDGFLSLDFIFEKDFKETLKDKDPEFYNRIKNQSIEDFVNSMMDMREKTDPFILFKQEYDEAAQSIRKRESIHWKEMLAVLSFAMNYPAKYLSAEDMLRLQKVLMPLISIVIAFVPQSSCEELLALHDAGKLEIISVGSDSSVEPDKSGGANCLFNDEAGNPKKDYYPTFVDCIGQPHLSFEDFPFKGLLDNKSISPAFIQFRSATEAAKQIEEGNKKVSQDKNGDYYLQVPGIRINDNFQVVNESGKKNSRIYIMAVPYIGGYNPDYSGLDFCEEASESIVNSIQDTFQIEGFSATSIPESI